MFDSMFMEKITLYKDGFTPLTIRRVTLTDETYFYEMLAYSHPHYLHERWVRINIPHDEIELQIQKYKGN